LGAEDQARLMAAVQGSSGCVAGADPPAPGSYATTRLKQQPVADFP
jgi:hypothetical protein